MANDKIILVFKATETYKYHNDMELGRVDNGEMVEVSPQVANKLLKDYPKNFFKLGEGETEKPKKSRGRTKELKPENTETK